jgi:hypothetical protein
MHEERRKGGEREIGHGIGRVLPAPLVGQGLAVMAQRGDQAVLDLHPHVESEIALRANRENRVGGRSSGRCCICDSPGSADWPKDRRSDGRKPLKSRPGGKMRTAAPAHYWLAPTPSLDYPVRFDVLTFFS